MSIKSFICISNLWFLHRWWKQILDPGLATGNPIQRGERLRVKENEMRAEINVDNNAHVYAPA